MAIVTFDPLAITTFQRLAGLEAFIEMLDSSLPEIELRQRDVLTRVAKEQGWDFGDYSVERDAIDERFRQWMPRFSAYSVIILLHSLVETQLLGCAQRVGKREGAVFTVRDMRGGPLDSAVLYLRKAACVDVTTDAVWSRLKDLQQLRNIIVHRAGRRGDAEDQQSTFDRLIRAYAPRLRHDDDDGWLYGEVWVSLVLCRELSRDVGAFFGRTLKAIGVPQDALPREYRDESGLPSA